jgi:8-oxo-dGTP diphosphatase
MNQLVTAAAALIHDAEGRVLLVRQAYGRRLWGLPGGRIEANETPTHAVVRDVRTETGLEIQVVDLVGLYHLIGGTSELPEMLTYAFRCEVVGGEACVNLPSKVAQVAWQDPSALPAPTTATTPVAVADSSRGRSGVVIDVVRGEPVSDAVPT